MPKKKCNHMNQIRAVKPGAEGCEECLTIGDKWVKLCICMTCGHVSCRDNSKNKHVTEHFLKTVHPLIRSFPDEDWTWCYIDEMYFALTRSK
ncbi:MAG: UBP-type zinc finger domain-containing protein [Chloroflexota bacterium]